MRFKSYILLILFISGLIVGCKSTDSVRETNYTKKYSAADLRQDIDYAYQTINEVHPDFYKNTALSDSLRTQLGTLKKDIKKSLGRAEFFSRLAPAITQLNDGHTTLGVPWPDLSDYMKKGGLIFPFDIFFVDGKTYVYRNYSTDQTIKPGAQLISVNDIPVTKMVSNFTNMLSGANIKWRHRRMEKQSDFFKAFMWFKYGQKKSYRLVYSVDDSVREKQVNGVTRKRLRSQRDTSASTVPLNYHLIGNHIGLLKISNFSRDEKVFTDFLRSSFDRINKSGVTKLIIDLRNNPGGDSGQAEELLSYLINEALPLTKVIKPRASKQFKSKMKKRIPGILRWLPLQRLDKQGRMVWQADEGSIVTLDEIPVEPKDKSRRFTDDVYLLVDEGTFSAATIFADVIKGQKLGVLIGRETGGQGGTMFAQPIRFQLPNTQLSLRVSSMIFPLRSENINESNVGVVPNIIVEENIDDELHHIDTIAERAKAEVNHE